MTTSEKYYYAQGRRIPLKPARNMIAIEAGKLKTLAGKTTSKQRSASQLRKITDSLSLLDIDKVPSSLDKSQVKQWAHPVYEAEGALIVPLPEIRVEDHRPELLADVRSWLAKRKPKIKITAVGENRLDLHVTSKSGAEAIDLANELHEHLHPTLAQTRFVRIVSKPTLRKSAAPVKRSAASR